MVRIACPFRHVVLFDTCVITQFRLHLEEELSVKTNKQVLEHVSSSRFSGCPSLVYFRLYIPDARFVMKAWVQFSLAVLAQPGNAPWKCTSGAFQDLHPHEVTRKFAMQKWFNASAVRLLTWRRFIFGLIIQMIWKRNDYPQWFLRTINE